MKKLLEENRKARFNYTFLEILQAGIVLEGGEVKSVLNHDSSISEGYCYIKSGELFIKGFTIQEYKNASYTNHDTKRDKKLLLNKDEIEKLDKTMQTNQGLTIVPTKLYVADNGKIKLEIALCKGKKAHDKRNAIRLRDVEREFNRKF